MRGLSLRLKIVFLLSAALCVSLLSYLLVGTRLVVEDKVSYIYDYNLAQVRTAAEAIEAHVERVETGAQVLGHWIADSGAKSDFSEALFEQSLKPLGVSGILFMSPNSEGYKQVKKLGVTEVNGVTAEALISQLGWQSQWVKSHRTLVGTSVSGILPVGGWVQAGNGQAIAYLALLKVDPKLMDAQNQQMEIHLVDSLGRSVLLASPVLQGVSRQQLQNFEHELLLGQFPQGVKDWNVTGTDYIVAYKRLKFPELMVLSYVPKASAYVAVQRLAQRSIALGVSIFLLALGTTLIFVKGLTRRLRQMWGLTRKVSEGDFSVRVPTRGQKPAGGDEVESLAHSFNAMASKIDDLMAQTAQKARMEKELETAQTVQSRFFPTDSFHHPNLLLGGTYVPASECAGDWWHYVQAGDHLITVVGDVTGHGVSAALVTASVHGAFALLVQQMERLPPGQAPSLSAVFNYLNTAVRASASGGASMTFVGSIINLKTGKLTVANASHFPPYLYSGAGADPEKPLSAVEPLLMDTCAALGRQERLEVKEAQYQLKPGDALIWYTDGFFEGPAAVGKSVSNKKLLKLLINAVVAHPTEMARACQDSLGELFAIMGNSQEKPDDITLVFAKVPESANFESAPAVGTSTNVAA